VLKKHVKMLKLVYHQPWETMLNVKKYVQPIKPNIEIGDLWVLHNKYLEIYI
jgi:hypothetical protein